MKKKILVNWDYTRADFFYPFKVLAEEFDLTFLYKYDTDSTDSSKYHGINIIYWNQFSTPYQMLTLVKPDGVIFHDLESFHQISLNVAARNKGLKTFVLEHGLRRGSEISVAYDMAAKEKKALQMPPPVSLKTTRFYLSSFRFAKNAGDLLRFLMLIYYRKRFGLTIGLNKAKYKFRRAYKYINFTWINASYIMERDGIAKEDVQLIGIPFFDELFNEFNHTGQHGIEPYYLLVDTPFVEDSNFNEPLEEKNVFLKKLNGYCLQNGRKLYVKLHPRSYHTEYLQHDNIVYYRDSNVVPLIRRADGCFFIHQSGLLPLSIIYNKAFLFNKYPAYNTDVVDNHFTNTGNYDRFTPEDLVFKDLNEAEKQRVTEHYFLYTDGKSTGRLGAYLSSELNIEHHA